MRIFPETFAPEKFEKDVYYKQNLLGAYEKENGSFYPYQKVKNNIVAFVQKYEPIWDKKESPLPFPTIIGIGFIVRENSLIATNSHVTKAFSKVFGPPQALKKELPVLANLSTFTRRYGKPKSGG